MRVVLSTSWSRGDVKRLVGLTVRWALGAVMRVCTPPDFAEATGRLVLMT